MTCKTHWRSNQVPTALFCDVVPDPTALSLADLVQAMPGTDLSRMNSIVEKLRTAGGQTLIGYGDNWLLSSANWHRMPNPS